MDNEELLRKTLGNSIRIHRHIVLGKTREKLTEDADIDSKYLGEVERGEVNVSVYYLYKIASGLNLSDPSKLLQEATSVVYTSMRKKQE